MKTRIRTRLAGLTALTVLAALAACSQAPHKVQAVEPTDDTVCVLDGMALKDAAGPKAQIHYTEGRPDFLCDLFELFDTVHAPESRRAITALFVQDMGKADWDHPRGHWIDAKTAFYVVGSGKHGSMGPTFGAFAGKADADAFAAREGGRVLRFDQITADMVRGPTAHDDGMH